MKIAQILHSETYGGMEKFCIELSNELAENNNDVLLLADPIFKPYISSKVVFQPICMKKSRRNIFNLIDIFLKIRRFKADIIHTHKQKSIKIIKTLKPFLSIPYIATKHDVFKKKAFSGIENAISISDQVSKTIEAKNCFIIRNGAHKKIITPQEKHAEFTVVAIGGLKPVKRFDYLINAAAELKEKGLPIKFLIVGEGEEREKLEALIKQHQLEDTVKLLGFRDDIPEILSRSHLQLICSESEGFSLAFIEGVFYSDALMSTPVSGCDEILPSSLLFEINNLAKNIESVFRQQEHYQHIFKLVKKDYENKLTIQYCANEHIKVYESIINA